MLAPDPGQPGENPIVSDAVLRQLYTTVQQLRTRRVPSSQEGACPQGQEAIYAASLLSVKEGDLLCEDGYRPKKLALERSPSWLEVGETPTPARLLLALGAASALHIQATGGLVLAYTAADDSSPAQWQQVLGIAGSGSLPMIVVALPGRRPGWLSSQSQRWGVPGIPVDSSDAVALYRVLQESILRARHGDGPALLEPISWTVSRAPDPLRALRQLIDQRERRNSSPDGSAKPSRAARTRGK